MLSKYIISFMEDYGLNLNEPFEIVGYLGKFVIDNKGILWNDDENKRIPQYEVLARLLSREINIRVKPFRPNPGEFFWFITVSGLPAVKAYNPDSTFDLLLVRSNKCYRSRSEAIANTDKEIEWYRAVANKE